VKALILQPDDNSIVKSAVELLEQLVNPGPKLTYSQV
jgi:hypothetical protein